jgi:hypothetical protein
MAVHMILRLKFQVPIQSCKSAVVKSLSDKPNGDFTFPL